MALSSAELLILLLVLLFSLYLYMNIRWSRNHLPPLQWPIVGILPFIAANLQNFHDSVSTVLAATDQNFKAHGPSGTSMRFFLTCDPMNVRHIFTRNFANYPKGNEFAAVFAVLSGTIFTADGESWRQQRAKIQHVLTRPELLDLMSRCCRDKIAAGLVPLLSRMAENATPFDMDDVLGRLVFDLTIMLVFGEDPGCLSTGMPPVPVSAALDTLMGVAFFRHLVPVSCWKMMRRLNIGPEKRLAKAESVLHGFVTEMIQGRISRRRAHNHNEVDILSHYTSDPDYLSGSGEPTDFLHKTFINFLVALRDPVGAALPWFVYNLATNPDAVSSIRKELAPIAGRKRAISNNGAMVILEPDETKGLVYLRAALFESLRLYPPGPIERKSVLADDVLPSGHKVHTGDTVLISVYAMGRMESVWGEDCRKYRPERWLTDDGAGLRYVPSYKFVSFNTGPRSCPGKNIAVAQMTCIAASVVWNFDVQVVEGHAVEPKLSVLLQMKNGLMVNVKKRQEYM